MRLLPRATVELIAELHGLAALLDDTMAGMDPASSSPYGMAQGRVYAATCRLAAIRLEELAFAVEELADHAAIATLRAESIERRFHAHSESETK